MSYNMRYLSKVKTHPNPRFEGGLSKGVYCSHTACANHLNCIDRLTLQCLRSLVHIIIILLQYNNYTIIQQLYINILNNYYTKLSSEHIVTIKLFQAMTHCGIVLA